MSCANFSHFVPYIECECVLGGVSVCECVLIHKAKVIKWYFQQNIKNILGQPIPFRQELSAFSKFVTPQDRQEDRAEWSALSACEFPTFLWLFTLSLRLPLSLQSQAKNHLSMLREKKKKTASESDWSSMHIIIIYFHTFGTLRRVVYS